MVGRHNTEDKDRLNTLRLERMIRWCAGIWMIIIVILSLMPSATVQKWIWDDIFSLDKVAHFILYAVAAFLILYGFERARKSRWITVPALIAFSILLEVLQSQMYLGRQFELLDILANSIGALFGAWFCLWFIQNFRVYVYSNHHTQ